MKVVIIAPRFPPQGELGGVEIATQNIAARLVAKGDDVHIVTSGVKSTIEKPGQYGVVHRVVQPALPFLGSLVFWCNIFFALKRIRPDMIHCQTIQMGVSGFVFKKISKTPYLIWCHGFDVYFSWKGKKMISRFVLNSANIIVALTDHMKHELEKNCKKNIIVLPNGVDIKRFSGFSKREIRDTLNVSVNQKVSIFVGRFYPVKGLGYLIEAFKTISQKIPEARLWLVGDGPEKKHLQEAVEKNGLQEKVIFPGDIDHQKIPEYLAMADVFVLPSLSEGFPLVLLEAMAAGLPIITTNVRGLPEIIKDGENGFLVEPKNSAQLVAKIQLLLEDVALAQKISIANQKKAQEYDWGNVVGKIEKMYSGIINKS